MIHLLLACCIVLMPVQSHPLNRDPYTSCQVPSGRLNRPISARSRAS